MTISYTGAVLNLNARFRVCIRRTTGLNGMVTCTEINYAKTIIIICRGRILFADQETYSETKRGIYRRLK